MYDGSVIGECYHRHTHKEFIKFLNIIDRQIAKEIDLHIIIDNYGTPKTKEVQQWLKTHRRFHFHFIPTSSSWLNMVERFFSAITTKMIRRGVFRSVEDLVEAVMRFIAKHNEEPKIYTWTKDADNIIAKWLKSKEALEVLR